MRLTVDGKDIEIDADPQMPLLWALRDIAGILGPKFGCGIAACGACTVVIDGALHPVQQAWLEEQVAQCGYCQAGQIMSAWALLEEIDEPTDEDIDGAMGGNLCRCGTYPRIRSAIKRAAALKLARA